MAMIFDLHTHSHCSDGALSPMLLMKRAVEQGVDVLAITDHDTVAASPFCQETPNGLTVIPGIEFSARWNSLGVHILGLNIDPDSDAITEGTKRQLEARQQRAERIGQKLDKLGITNSYEGALQIAAGAMIGRPHFAQHLVETGTVESVEMAFKKYLGAGKPGDLREHWPDISTIVAWIREAGGIAVLAHPLKYRLTRTRLKHLLDHFIAVGGQAMEVISGQQTAFTTRGLGQLCVDKQLLGSCGSDFHRPGPGWSELGNFGTLPPRVTPVWEHF